jgi:Ca-activated chloride channel homolog
MKRIMTFIFALPFSFVFGQNENKDISKGNEAYKKQEYSKATSFYQRALQQTPNNNVAAFNLGNALFREDKADEAMAQFEASAEAGKSKTEKGDALYNRGVVLTKQKKLEESIAAYKDVLRLNPVDTLARQNLQRALNEKQKQDQQNQNKDQKQKKPQNKLNKQQVAQMLNALQEQEKQLQQKMQKQKTPAPGQPDKDW